MHLKPSLSLYGLLLLLASCEQKVELPVTAMQEPERHYVINPAGDSIPTGVPIPIKGKRIHPDSVAKPRTIGSVQTRPLGHRLSGRPGSNKILLRERRVQKSETRLGQKGPSSSMPKGKQVYPCFAI